MTSNNTELTPQQEYEKLLARIDELTDKLNDTWFSSSVHHVPQSIRSELDALIEERNKFESNNSIEVTVQDF
jgi:hypothetical protein